ncbi:hypothetical protein AGMMS50268_15190 [Spirochaetia bacterium]|nr:hypothetical protein AGMMS50268_15190 [Spirochaetia bacterium]
MARKLSESVLEKLLDYYGNFAGDPRITGMIAAAGKAAGISPMQYAAGDFVRALDDDELDIAAAGDGDQIRIQQAEHLPNFPGTNTVKRGER